MMYVHIYAEEERPQQKGKGLVGRTVEGHMIDGVNVTGGRLGWVPEPREKN